MSAELNSKNGQHKDPVCNMTVSSDSEYRFLFANNLYLFCSENCLHKFREHPQQFLDKKLLPPDETGDKSTTYTCPMHPEVQQQGTGSCPKCGMALEPMGVPVAATQTEYTFPMHPEVRQDHPGQCPKCGMALESVTVNVEEKNEELIDMSRRFWVSTVLAIPVFILAMVADVLPAWLPDGFSMQSVQWVEFVLATPVVLWGGWPFFVRGWQSVQTWNLNMFTLIALGVSVAWVYSVVALFVPEIFFLFLNETKIICPSDCQIETPNNPPPHPYPNQKWINISVFAILIASLLLFHLVSFGSFPSTPRRGPLFP